MKAVCRGPACEVPHLPDGGLPHGRARWPARVAGRRSGAGIRVETAQNTFPLDGMYPYGYSGRMFTVRQTEQFVAWLDALKDMRAQVRIAARLRQAEAGNLGDWQPIDGEVSEMRVHYGPGYRLYFVRRGRVIVVMLNAGDKSSQKRDIRHALKLASELGDDL